MFYKALFVTYKLAPDLKKNTDVYYKINNVTNMPVYSRLKQDYINFFPVSNFVNVT